MACLIVARLMHAAGTNRQSGGDQTLSSLKLYHPQSVVWLLCYFSFACMSRKKTLSKFPSMPPSAASF